MELISQARDEATIIKEQIMSETSYKKFEADKNFF